MLKRIRWIYESYKEHGEQKVKKRIRINRNKLYKERAPHKPTRVHRNKKAYDRNKEKQRFRKEVNSW